MLSISPLGLHPQPSRRASPTCSPGQLWSASPSNAPTVVTVEAATRNLALRKPRGPKAGEETRKFKGLTLSCPSAGKWEEDCGTPPGSLLATCPARGDHHVTIAAPPPARFLPANIHLCCPGALFCKARVCRGRPLETCLHSNNGRKAVGRQ